MKNISAIFILFNFLTACDLQEERKYTIKNNDTAAIKSVQPVPATANPASDISSSVMNELTKDTLVSVAILEEKSEDPFEKYGLEFSGNCYDCDLAELKIDNSNILLLNTCDPQIRMKLPVTKIVNNNTELTIECGNTKFTFLKTESTPIYELNISGTLIEHKNLRLGLYFTFKKMITQFRVHDCGDFEG